MADEAEVAEALMAAVVEVAEVLVEEDAVVGEEGVAVTAEKKKKK